MTTDQRSELPVVTDEQETLKPAEMQFKLALRCQVASFPMHSLLTQHGQRGNGIASLSRNQFEGYLTKFELSF